jgi:hypothetical protein
MAQTMTNPNSLAVLDCGVQQNRPNQPITRDGLAEQAKELLQRLEENEHISELEHQQEQVLLYEGHFAPGCFVMLEGKVEISSVEFGETRNIWIVPPNKQSLMSDKVLENRKEKVYSFLLMPEAQQLELRSPYTIRFLHKTKSLFVPRTLLQTMQEKELLCSLSHLQERQFQL